MVDMDPGDAAQFALDEGDAPEPEGGAFGAGDGPMQRLFDGDAPGPAVSELQMDYDMPQHFAIAARGILRVATGTGIPPIFEILMGTVLTVMQYSDGLDVGSGDTNGGDDGDDLPDPDTASPPPVE